MWVDIYSKPWSMATSFRFPGHWGMVGSRSFCTAGCTLQLCSALLETVANIPARSLGCFVANNPEVPANIAAPAPRFIVFGNLWVCLAQGECVFPVPALAHTCAGAGARARCSHPSVAYPHLPISQAFAPTQVICCAGALGEDLRGGGETCRWSWPQSASNKGRCGLWAVGRLTPVHSVCSG